MSYPEQYSRDAYFYLGIVMSIHNAEPSGRTGGCSRESYKRRYPVLIGNSSAPSGIRDANCEKMSGNKRVVLCEIALLPVTACAVVVVRTCNRRSDEVKRADSFLASVLVNDCSFIC